METKRAVIYARYSSDKQTEQSIEGQVKICLPKSTNGATTLKYKRMICKMNLPICDFCKPCQKPQTIIKDEYKTL